MTASRVRSARDAGFSLIELLITMILMGVVSALVVAAVAQAGRIVTHTEDEETGLQDAKIILDRVGRDIRESRGAECDGGLADPGDPLSADPTCLAHVQLWIDSNSDYLREATEIITWRLQANPDGQHFDVWRYVGTGAGGTPVTSKRQASSLIVRIAFTYDSPIFADVTQINLNMEYDAFVGRGTDVRKVDFNARLRNKG